jgi:hypothetical protein
VTTLHDGYEYVMSPSQHLFFKRGLGWDGDVGKSQKWSYMSDPYPAFFLLIATTSNKNFKSAETVNVKFGVYEFRDKGQ